MRRQPSGGGGGAGRAQPTHPRPAQPGKTLHPRLPLPRMLSRPIPGLRPPGGGNSFAGPHPRLSPTAGLPHFRSPHRAPRSRPQTAWRKTATGGPRTSAAPWLRFRARSRSGRRGARGVADAQQGPPRAAARARRGPRGGGRGARGGGAGAWDGRGDRGRLAGTQRSRRPVKTPDLSVDGPAWHDRRRTCGRSAPSALPTQSSANGDKICALPRCRDPFIRR